MIQISYMENTRVGVVAFEWVYRDGTVWGFVVGCRLGMCSDYVCDTMQVVRDANLCENTHREDHHPGGGVF